MSVISIYSNESRSMILRTVTSVVNRTPSRYLKEFILVDDASGTEELKDKSFIEFINITWPDGIVKVLKKSERIGLIRARLEGARLATGDVLVFLDAHIEVLDGW